MTTLRTTLAAFVATAGLSLGLVTVASAPADAAQTRATSSKVKIKSTPLRPKMKLQVKASRGAVLYSARTGKIVRDRKDQARRVARGSVRLYSHRVQIKSRTYARISGTRYIVRLRDLRKIPTPRQTARPVPKPKPPVVTPPKNLPPVAAPSVVRGPHNGEVTTLVFGDSISTQNSTWYNDIPGDPKQAWWSVIQQATGTLPTRVTARPGAGMVNDCYWTTFDEWLVDVDTVKPDFILVEGGRNDPWTCRGGAPRLATQDEQSAAISGFAEKLRAAADRNGIAPEHVYLFNVWGSGSQMHRARVVATMKAAAKANGLTFVDVPPLAAGYTPDETHPNADGARLVATEFLRRSDYAQRLAAWVPKVPAVS